jgi:RimJ/RimL family protein N-acetyltransferase
MLHVRGQFLHAREMTADDAGQVVAWRNHPDSARWLVQWEPMTVEGHLRFFAAARDRGDLLLIYAAPDGTPLGTGALYGFDRRRGSAEWGRLCFGPEPRPPFAALEAGYLTQRIGLEVLHLGRLHCACALENAAAVRLNEALGYRREGLRRKHLLTPDGYRDVVEFGMFPEEFRRAELEKMLYRQAEPPAVAAQP